MNLRAWGRLAVCAAVSVTACHSRTMIGPPPSAPRVSHPESAIPADLDVVIRLDLRRIRETLGPAEMAEQSARAVRQLHGTDDATDALLLRALSQTDTLWLGLRPTHGLDAADNVLVMSGHFSDFDPRRAESTPPFGLPLDLGGDVRRYDRPHPNSRSAPARIYRHGDDLIVSLSEAEIDSVERSFEEQRGAPGLEPIEKGVLSAALRPRALPKGLFAGAEPLQRLAERAERIELNADLTGAGLSASLALKFADPSTAEQLGTALTELRDALRGGSGRLAKFAARLEMSSAGPYLTANLSLGRDELSELVNCRGSACAW